MHERDSPAERGRGRSACCGHERLIVRGASSASRQHRPALILLALFERVHVAVASRMTPFGRVPFFFYVVHIAFIHALAVKFAWITVGDIGWTSGSFLSQKPSAYGLNLFGVYVVWLCVVVVLYPACRWFAALKRKRHEWWWSPLRGSAPASAAAHQAASRAPR